MQVKEAIITMKSFCKKDKAALFNLKIIFKNKGQIKISALLENKNYLRVVYC